MPSITLSELVADFADAAVALQEVSALSSLRSFAGGDIQAGKVFEPPTHTVRVGRGDVDVPIATLKNHHGMRPSKFTLSLSTDAILEGRSLSFRPAQNFQPTKGVSAAVDSQNRREGFLVDGPYQFGSLPINDKVVLNGVEYEFHAFIYGPNAGFVQLRFESETEVENLVGFDLRVWDLDGTGETLLDLGHATLTGSGSRCYLTWREFGDMEWFSQIADGEAFGVSFTDALHNKKVAEALGRRGYREGETCFDIMVTFTDGLGENASQISMTAEFAHHNAPEGVEILIDRLNQDLRAKLE